MSEFRFVDSARAHVDTYQVPDGPVRDLSLQIGALLDGGSLDALDLVVLQRVSMQFRDVVADVYRPRSPLEAQLEYDRARKHLTELGIEAENWVAAEDPVVLSRWARWVEQHGAD